MSANKKRRVSGNVNCLMYSEEIKEEINDDIKKEDEMIEVKLPNIMEVVNNDSEKSEPRRSGRKRSLSKPLFASLAITPSVPLPHRMLNIETDMPELKRIYLDKTVKKTNLSLETIFETPNGEIKMSGKKFRRMLTFQDTKNNKLKKRTMKVQKLSSANRKKVKKISMAVLMKKLDAIESE